jgi:acid phosphatase type 7
MRTPWQVIVAGSLAIMALSGTDARAAGIDKGPYLMHPTTVGITVCWISNEPEAGTVAVEGARETFEEAVSNRIHRVRVTGLEPYKLYKYSVTCGSDKKGGSFRTAAPPGQPFKFVAYGDNRTQPKVHRAVLNRMSRFEPDFIIQSGDQVADGTKETQWDEFWQVASKALSRSAYYPSLGNHEKNGSPYYRFFDVPAEYSFDYGDVHFVALNSNRPAAEFRAQEEWLRKDLAAHQDAKWRVVFFHHTVHTCTAIPSRRVGAAALAKRLEPIFQEQKVQLVVNGHDHNYQRHVANGITYIVTGGGGAPLYNVKPNTPYLITAKKAHHHCEINVDGSKMAVRVVEPSGRVIETFEINAGG